MQRHRTILLVDRANLALGTVACLGIAQFVLSTFWAITLYDDYSFTENFLSDLGRVQAKDADNSASAAVFNCSLVILGLSLLPFLVVMPSVVGRFQTGLRVAGVITALGVIGAGLTPYDRYCISHLVSLVLWIGALLYMATAMAINCGCRGIRSMAIAAATLALFMAAFAYAFGGSHEGYVVYQKVLVVMASLWICVAVAVVSISMHTTVLSRRRIIVEQQARRYLLAMEKGDWRRKQ